MSETRIIDAVKNGDKEAVRQLTDTGEDVNQQGEQGWTPLNWAAGQGDVEMIQLLLDRGADVTRTGRDNRTPLMIAKAAGRQEASDLLTEVEKRHGTWKDPRTHQPYCKAFHLRDLRQFDGWPGDGASHADAPLADGSIVYLHQDFTVTRSMWHGEDIVFEDVTPAWQTFCAEELSFDVPEDLR